jgi:hypothetical protein
MQTGAAMDAEAVAHYFALILGRQPENAAVVEHYLKMGLAPADFVRVLLESEEVNERYRRRLALGGMTEPPQEQVWPDRPGAERVLLFGAYGNGNLGDSAQAAALASLLRRLLPGPLNLAACSWERRAPFAFPDGVRVAHDALLRPDLLPRHGLVAIGGGGLFGAPHFPLYAERWARWFAGRGVRWALLGIGGSAEAMAEPDWARAYRTLVAGAAFVGVRDAATLAAAQAINPAACWFPDPVLASVLPDLGSWVEDAAGWESRPVDVLIIPRFPNGPADAAANQAALAWRRRLVAAGRRVVVAAMERVLDAAVLQGEEVVYVDEWSALERLCREARLVLSLRLHGAIAGLAAGCVVHGLVQPKIGDLMAELGVAAWFAPGPFPTPEPDLSAAAAAAFRLALAPGLVRLRLSLDAAMQTAARALAGAVA